MKKIFSITFSFLTIFFLTNFSFGQDNSFLDGFKYAVVVPVKYKNGSLDPYGIESRAIKSINNIGLKCLIYEQTQDWPNDAISEPCLIAFITLRNGKSPNMWNCGRVRIVTSNCKKQIIKDDLVRSPNAVCDPPYTCCYPKWVKAVTNYFNDIKYAYNPNLNNLRTEYPDVEITLETEESIRIYLSKNYLEPIEGIYMSYQSDDPSYYKFGVIKRDGKLKAIILESNLMQWKPGEVKAIFEQSSMKGYYSVKWFMSNKTPNETFGTLENEGLLAIELGESNTGDKRQVKFIKMYPSSADKRTRESQLELGIQAASLQGQQIVEKEVTIGRSDVDINIPTGNINQENVFALIIGNEDYSSYQTGLESEINVKFANNDAVVFKKYLMNTMGVPEKNMYLLLNATYGQTMQYLSKLEAITEILGEKAEIIFYYSGHGFPDEVTKEPYIMPVDASATNLISAIKLNQIYGKLTKYPTKRVTIFLDACFSGGARDQGLLAARSVKIKPQENQVNGNVVVFTASSGIEPALAYDDKQHGMFTYYLLKKLQESEGDLSYQELGAYIQDQVELQSVVINNKRQKPQINLGSGIDEDWGEWNFINK